MKFIQMGSFCNITAWLTTLLVAACGTFSPYSNTELSDAEVASIECYWRYYFVFMEECSVSAIDGQRPGLSALYNKTSKLPSGDHWVEVQIEASLAGAHGNSTCVFEYDFLAAHQYKINAHSLKADRKSPNVLTYPLFAASINFDEISPKGASTAHEISAICSSGGGSFCRKASDCVPHPDITCVPLLGHSFGTCRWKPEK
jgi:hypothetical protein